MVCAAGWMVDLTRRALLAGLTAAALPRLASASGGFQLAICSETFQGRSFAEMCRGAKRTGYSDVEIAPFTLGDDPAALPAARRRELRNIMASEGVTNVALRRKAGSTCAGLLTLGRIWQMARSSSLVPANSALQ